MVPVDGDFDDIAKEIRILKKCDSVYVVKYYGSYSFEDNLWIVMEYCGGGAVLDLMEITEQTLSEGRFDKCRGLGGAKLPVCWSLLRTNCPYFCFPTISNLKRILFFPLHNSFWQGWFNKSLVLRCWDWRTCTRIKMSIETLNRETSCWPKMGKPNWVRRILYSFLVFKLLLPLLCWLYWPSNSFSLALPPPSLQLILVSVHNCNPPCQSRTPSLEHRIGWPLKSFKKKDTTAKQIYGV